MLLQVDSSNLIGAAGNVQPGDNSGYTFAVVILTATLLIVLTALKKLWDENKVLQDSAVERAEKMTESLITATNAQERAFNRVAERLDDQAELLKEIKASK